MKLLDHSISHTRRALCAATLAVVVGAITASAQSSSSNPGATSNRNYGSSTSGSNQNSTTSTDSSRRNNTSNAPTSGSASGSYNSSGTTGSSGSGSYSSGTRSGGSDANYGGSTTSTTSSMSGSTATGSDKLSWGDKRFVTKAGDHGQAEVQLAQLATQQASNPEVRRYAQRLVTDHTRVNSELMSLASSKNVQLEQDQGQDRTYRRLSNRQGQDFDQEFIEQMIDMHEADIKLFEKASEDAKDQELRSFASRHIGHLREHLQQAQSLRSTIMPTGRTHNDASSGGSASTTSTSANPSGASDSGSGAYQTSGSGSSSTTPGTTTGSASGSSSGGSSSGSTRSGGSSSTR